MHQRNLRFLFEDYRSFYFHSLVKSTFLVSKGLLCLFDKKNNIWARADIKVLFSCSTRHLTCSLRLLVSYRIKHSKRNSISARAHMLSSISLWIHCHGSLYFDQWEKHFNFLSGKGHFQRYLKRRCPGDERRCNSLPKTNKLTKNAKTQETNLNLSPGWF